MWKGRLVEPPSGSEGGTQVCIGGFRASEATGLLLDRDKEIKISSRERRRARQNVYRQELNSQVAEDTVRLQREMHTIHELERAEHLKSVSLTTDNTP